VGRNSRSQEGDKGADPNLSAKLDTPSSRIRSQPRSYSVVILLSAMWQWMGTFTWHHHPEEVSCYDWPNEKRFEKHSKGSLQMAERRMEELHSLPLMRSKLHKPGTSCIRKLVFQMLKPECRKTILANLGNRNVLPFCKRFTFRSFIFQLQLTTPVSCYSRTWCITTAGMY